jgi:hypothetical protein
LQIELKSSGIDTSWGWGWNFVALSVCCFNGETSPVALLLLLCKPFPSSFVFVISECKFSISVHGSEWKSFVKQISTCEWVQIEFKMGEKIEAL